ncbi:MAG: hypothetical protein AB4426_21715 [Xenococcaceae cyanobacterium]
MFLVLLETSGNQNFIFATNKLRENIGASELTYRAGTQWVLNAVGKITQNERLRVWPDSDRLRNLLIDSKLNPPIENSDSTVEIIIAASGKALLLAKKKDTAQKIIREVTRKALQEAPGIDICGVWVEFEWNEPKSLDAAIQKIYQEFQIVHSSLRSPHLRFLRLPVVEACATSALPASQLSNLNNEKVAISAMSNVKRKAAAESLERMQLMVRDIQYKFAKNIDKLEKIFEESLKWLAVVHADGNGLGQIFLNFGDYAEDNRDYVERLRRFSLALDLCTEKAFKAALNVFPLQQDILPVVPLVLGGDDLTVVCDGEYAMEFTRKFLQEFEKETAKTEHLEGIIPQIATKALASNRLSSCGGIAIIKPHFPFHVAYELAEDLLKSAKKVKKKVTHKDTSNPLPCSALDFHIVYDSSGVELDSIRQRLRSKAEEFDLYKRPLVITELEQLQGAEFIQWAEFYHWHEFEKKVEFLRQKDEAGNYKFPPSQGNQLRSACFLGKAEADAEYKLIKQRYQYSQ